MMALDPVDCPLWNTQYHLRHAHEHFVRADALNRAGSSSKVYESLGLGAIKEAASVLGFDLVKREPAKQSEAA